MQNVEWVFRKAFRFRIFVKTRYVVIISPVQDLIKIIIHEVQKL